MEGSELDSRAGFLHDTEDEDFAKKAREMYKQYLDYKKDYFRRHNRSLAEERMTDDYRGHQIFGLITPKSEDQDKWKGYAIQAEIWRIYESGPFDQGRPVRRNTSIGVYETLCANVRTFCLHAGSISGSFDPFENIGLLQQHVASQKIYSTSDLIVKIQELQTTNGEQQKIIVSLYLRHVIEKLAGTPPHRMSQPDFWKNFLIVAFDNARKAKNNGEPHPFSELIKNPKYEDYLRGIAQSMYSVLSGNIHEFCDGKLPVFTTDKWNVGEIKVMNALMPAIRDGKEPNWTAEQFRFGYDYEEEKSNQERLMAAKKARAEAKALKRGKLWWIRSLLGLS